VSTSERVEFQARIPDAIDSRNAGGVSLKGSGTQQLARHAYVRDRKNIALAESACGFVRRKPRLGLFEALTQPVLSPCHRRAIVRTKLINQMPRHARGDERMMVCDKE
jgi:hypothetical protein